VAISLAQAIVESAAVTGTSQTATYGSNVTAGNTLVAIVNYSAITGTVTVADSLNTAAGNWTQQGIHQARGRTQGVYFLKNTLGGAAPVVTATVSASQTQLAVLIIELTGNCNIDAFLQSDALSSGSQSCGPITTTGSADFLFSYNAAGASMAGTAGWTFATGSTNNRGYEYIANQAAGSYTATYTCTAATSVSTIIAFIPGAGTAQSATVTITAAAALSDTAKATHKANAGITAAAALSANAVAAIPCVGTAFFPVNASSIAVNVSGTTSSVDRITASVALSATARAIWKAINAITASAAVTANATNTAKATDALTAGASLSLTAKVTHQGNVALAPRSVISPTAKIVGAPQVIITASSAISAASVIIHHAICASAAGSALTAIAKSVHSATDALTAKGLISATATVNRHASVAIASSASLSANGTLAILYYPAIGTSHFSVNESDIAVNQGQPGAALSIAAKTVLSAQARALCTAINATVAQAQVSAQPSVARKSTVTIHSQAAVSASATVGLPTGPVVTISAGISISATGTLFQPSSSASLAAKASIWALPTLIHPITPPIPVSPILPAWRQIPGAIPPNLVGVYPAPTPGAWVPPPVSQIDIFLANQTFPL
jgi:hypothetical protein